MPSLSPPSSLSRASIIAGGGVGERHHAERALPEQVPPSHAEDRPPSAMFDADEIQFVRVLIIQVEVDPLGASKLTAHSLWRRPRSKAALNV